MNNHQEPPFNIGDEVTFLSTGRDETGSLRIKRITGEVIEFSPPAPAGYTWVRQKGHKMINGEQALHGPRVLVNKCIQKVTAGQPEHAGRPLNTDMKPAVLNHPQKP